VLEKQPFFIDDCSEAFKRSVIRIHYDLGKTAENTTSVVSTWAVDEYAVLSQTNSNVERLLENLFDVERPLGLDKLRCQVLLLNVGAYLPDLLKRSDKQQLRRKRVELLVYLLVLLGCFVAVLSLLRLRLVFSC
jgi:hypothetical protein